jgi:hypothetical protein
MFGGKKFSVIGKTITGHKDRFVFKQTVLLLDEAKCIVHDDGGDFGVVRLHAMNTCSMPGGGNNESLLILGWPAYRSS